MKKSILSFTLLISFIVSQINITPLHNVIASSEENQYVIIKEVANGHEVVTDTMTQYQANCLKSNDDIVVVEKDGEVKGSWTENNIFDKNQQEKNVNENSHSSTREWNMQIINADTNSALSVVNSVTGSAIKIALIDSGVNYSEHINIVERKNFIEDDENVSYLYEDISGHGTSIAGIIGYQENDMNDIIGINPNVEIYSARVLNKNLTAPISRVVDAIYWAINKGVNIISISFGTTENSDALKAAIQDAYNAGILIIAAAGNNGVIEYPAAYNQVMAVGSVDSNGDVSKFSPSSHRIEIVAPGNNIVSSAAFGGEMKRSGTSMSVPHVVGVASALWQIDTSLTADFIRKLIDYSANLYGSSESYGNGLVDLNYGLQIYDEFKNIYKKDDLKSRVSEAEDAGLLNNNNSDIHTGYVEGS